MTVKVFDDSFEPDRASIHFAIGRILEDHRALLLVHVGEFQPVALHYHCYGGILGLG